MYTEYVCDLISRREMPVNHRKQPSGKPIDVILLVLLLQHFALHVVVLRKFWAVKSGTVKTARVFPAKNYGEVKRAVNKPPKEVFHMAELSSFGARMKWVVDTFFPNQMKACYVLDIASPSQLRLYIADKGYASAKVLIAAHNFGLSTDWLLVGTGHLWNNTSSGQALRDRLVEDVRAGKLSLDDIPEGSRFPFTRENPTPVGDETRDAAPARVESKLHSAEHTDHKTSKTKGRPTKKTE